MAAKKKKSKAGGAGSKKTKLVEMMRGIDFCMMSTISRGGVIRTRPMSNNGEVEFDGDAWFFSWRDSQKVRDLEKDSAVALSYVAGTKSKPVWISIRGKGRVVDDVAKKKELWLKELDRWFDKGPEDEKVVLIRVRAAHASWWSYEEQDELSLKS